MCHTDATLDGLTGKGFLLKGLLPFFLQYMLTAKPVAKQGRKATGLTENEDSRVAHHPHAAKQSGVYE